MDEKVEAMLPAPSDSSCSSDEMIRRLKERELAPQLSDEWFRIRKEELFSATDIGALLGMDKYKTREKVLTVKGWQEDDHFHGNEFTEHGKTFEPILNMIHEWMCGEPIDSLGLLRHPQVPFVGASPDGIGSQSLRLKEFKCPLRRVILPNECPPHYWVQVQTQLQVCNLTQADYIEGMISKTLLSVPPLIDDEEEPWPRPEHHDSKFTHWVQQSHNPFQRSTRFWGYIVHTGSQWIYPQVCGCEMGDRPRYESIQSIQKQLDQMSSSPDVKWYRWECHTYHCKPILRDQEWWMKSLPVLQESWDEVLRRRSRGRPERADPTTAEPRKRRKIIFLPSVPTEDT